MAVETPLPDISDNITLFKSIYSVGLLIFSIAMVMGLIFTGQTKISSEVSPILAFAVIWFAIIWLTIWVRVLFSVAAVVFSFAVTFTALFQGKTTVWEGIPPAAAMVIFIFLMCVVGMLEAMQIAFFAVAKICAADRGSNVFARKTAHLLFSGSAKNLPGFMVGRQLCVIPQYSCSSSSSSVASNIHKE
jgi:Silicon transporter